MHAFVFMPCRSDAKDLITYNSAINACGHWETALALLQQMISQDFQPAAALVGMAESKELSSNEMRPRLHTYYSMGLSLNWALKWASFRWRVMSTNHL